MALFCLETSLAFQCPDEEALLKTMGPAQKQGYDGYSQGWHYIKDSNSSISQHVKSDGSTQFFVVTDENPTTNPDMLLNPPLPYRVQCFYPTGAVAEKTFKDKPE